MAQWIFGCACLRVRWIISGTCQTQPDGKPFSEIKVIVNTDCGLDEYFSEEAHFLRSHAVSRHAVACVGAFEHLASQQIGDLPGQRPRLDHSPSGPPAALLQRIKDLPALLVLGK